MSETDDTDDLLLIPPDFFLIDSELEHPIYGTSHIGPYYSIVECLIDQVVDLEGRINNIETTSSERSFVSSSLDYQQTNMSSFRKYNSSDELYQPQSTQSTPQKPLTKLRLNSLPASPNINRFSPKKSLVSNREYKSPGKSNGGMRDAQIISPNRNGTTANEGSAMLNEIDNFVSKVKTIRRINASRNLENDFNAPNSTKPQPLEVDQMLQQIDEEQRQLDARLRTKEDQLYRQQEQPFVKETTWRPGDNAESVPDLGAGLKQQYYSLNENLNRHAGDFHKLLKPAHSDITMPNTSYTTMDKSSDSSSENTQTTAYNRSRYGGRNDLVENSIHSNALNALNMHKKLLGESSSSEEKVNIKQKHKEHHRTRRDQNSVSHNLGLMSLADIWAANSHPHNINPSKVLQKLQEEKLRRQHCEQLIQDLQNRNLELQQRLAVAVKVDDTKNSTILQFQEALDKLASKFDGINKEKLNWEQEISKIKSKYSHDLEEANQRAAYHEKEASKALNLAHGNQEKLSSLEKRCRDLQYEMQSIESKFSRGQDNYLKETEKTKQLSDILSRKEIELNESKQILSDAREEISQSKRAVEVCQTEFTSMKNECAKLQSELRAERNKNNALNEQKRKLLNEVESVKSMEKNLQEKLSKTKDQLESNKLELRNFYQGQVEILVQNKLKEFQNQLDQAETSYKEDIKKREMSIAKTAAFHIQQISEKYTLEIQLLEEKHQEEKRLYNIQLIQYKQQNESLHAKLGSIQEKRVHVAQQLQKIMESQWNEALKIISSSRSPTMPDQAFNTIDQLNSLKSKSYSNLEEVFSQEELLEPRQQQQHPDEPRRKHEIHSSTQHVESLSSLAETDNAHGVFAMAMETPVSSRMKNDGDVQKYIQLLLNCRPGNPTNDVGKTQDNDGDKHTDRSAFHHPDQESLNKQNSKGPPQRDRRLGKPPWK